MKAVWNNVPPGEGDLAEMERAGLVEAGSVRISQRALRKFLDAQAEVERLASLLRFALLRGGSVEQGDLDTGLFRDKERKVNWRQGYIDMGGDAAALNAATPQTESAPRLRVYPADERPKGRQVAPTADGQPANVGEPVDKADAEAA